MLENHRLSSIELCRKKKNCDFQYLANLLVKAKEKHHKMCNSFKSIPPFSKKFLENESNDLCDGDKEFENGEVVHKRAMTGIKQVGSPDKQQILLVIS